MRKSHVGSAVLVFLGAALACSSAWSQPGRGDGGDDPYRLLQIEQVQEELDLLDEQKAESVYTGNVFVQQGSMQIRADQVTVHHREDRHPQHIIAVGKPATYRQRPDNKKEDVTAKASKLQVYPQRDLVRLERDARVTQEGNVYTGNIIEYDNKNDVIKMKGNIGTTDTGKQKKGRIRMTIQPTK